MRIFITGGTGFIGSYVVRELLGQGNSLLLLSRQPRPALPWSPTSNIDVVRGDLSDITAWKDELKTFRPQAAIHMAWEGLPDYGAVASARNLKHGLDLITALADSGIESMVCTGSCWEYGQQAGRLSEDMGVKPSNAFAAAKNALHWLGREIARERGLRFVWTRLFYVYGPGQRPTSLIPHVIDCVRKGQEPDSKTPSARNDFIYVEDAARAISAIAAGPAKAGVYNIGSGSSTSVSQIVETVYDLFDLPPKGTKPTSPSPSSGVDFWADISRIRADFSWRPEVDIIEGIEKTINYREKVTP